MSIARIPPRCGAAWVRTPPQPVWGILRLPSNLAALVSFFFFLNCWAQAHGKHNAGKRFYQVGRRPMASQWRFACLLAMVSICVGMLEASLRPPLGMASPRQAALQVCLPSFIFIVRRRNPKAGKLACLPALFL